MSEDLRAILDLVDALGGIALTMGAVWAIATDDLPLGRFAKRCIYAGVVTSGVCGLVTFGFWVAR